MAWLYCPVCRKERKATGKNNMSPHGRWDEKLKTTVPCEGKGKPGSIVPPRR